MAEAHLEIETKFDVPPDYAVPDLGGLDGVAGVQTDTVTLSSTYYDTARLDLARFRLALRRREGSDDVGWHLKVPAKKGRTELRWPLTDDDRGMPDEADAMLEPFLRGASVQPAVRVDTIRSRTHLCDEDGRLLVEVANADVRVTGLNAEVKSPRWHEVEVEVGAGDQSLLSAVIERLLDVGAHPSPSRSKLARALVGIGNEEPPRQTAGDVLKAYLSRQCDALVATNFAIRSDEDDAVHQARVACRRYRSTLRSFADCFDEGPAAHLDAELRWYADVLGPLRDLEVQRAHLREVLDELPDELVVGPVREHIETSLAGEFAQHRADMAKAMSSERYVDLLAEAVGFVANAPFTERAMRPPQSLRDDVDRIEAKLSKRMRKATKRRATDEQVHSARKAGKRARYAAELTDNANRAARITQLQDLLGEFQDSVVAAELLRRLAADAWNRGDDGFTYGVLVMNERQRGQASRRKARKSSRS